MVSSGFLVPDDSRSCPKTKLRTERWHILTIKTIFGNFNLTVVEKTKHLLNTQKLTKYLKSFVFDELLESINDKKIFVFVVMSNIARV